MTLRRTLIYMTSWYIIQVDFEYLSDIDTRLCFREYTTLITRAMRVSNKQSRELKAHLDDQGITYEFVRTTYTPQTAKRFNLNRGY